MRIILIILLSFICSCSSIPIAKEFDNPIFYANQEKGDCTFVKNSCNYKHGLLIAVWEDGRILRTVSDRTVGVRYIYGKVNKPTSELIEKLLSNLRKLDDSGEGASFHTAKHELWLINKNDRSDSKIWWYDIPQDEKQTEVILKELMAIKLESLKVYDWDELPRFGPPVIGHW